MCSFQGLVSNKSAAAISCLRACHPSSPSFPSAVEKVFHDLAAIEAAPASSLSSSGSSDALAPRSTSAVVNAPRKARAGGPSAITEASFLQLLQQLIADIPKPLQTRLLELALSVSSSTETPSSQGVGLARFQRGVQACLLVEELVDAATLLFQALEPSNTGSAAAGGVAADALMTALRSAATAQFPREVTAALTPILARPQASSESTATAAPTDTTERLLQLNDVYDVLFDFAFLP
jgi:hypothetical protein